MYIQNTADVPPTTAPHGEMVREVGGHTAGGLTQHSVAHITLPPGKASRKHYHPEAEESYYILAGTARVVIAGESQRLHAGDMVAICPQQVHQIFNAGSTPLIFLAICVPPWTPECSVFLEE